MVSFLLLSPLMNRAPRLGPFPHSSHLSSGGDLTQMVHTLNVVPVLPGLYTIVLFVWTFREVRSFSGMPVSGLPFLLYVLCGGPISGLTEALLQDGGGALLVLGSFRRCYIGW